MINTLVMRDLRARAGRSPVRAPVSFNPMGYGDTGGAGIRTGRKSMGFDYHGLRVLAENRERGGALGKTLTLGRQEIHAPEWTVRQVAGVPDDYDYGRYCENLLKDWFGATSVDSIDVSEYEGATVLHDMNYEVPPTLWERYDAIIDFGTTEHIFNAPTALRNCSLMCKPGGVLIHVLPGNNQCGHGFWQFSPELFLSLYDPRRGYSESQVYTADIWDVQNVTEWFRVDDGRRLEVSSSNPIYVIARAVRASGAFSHASVQQSDYLHLWKAGG